ncbi:hypothetical protein HAX54_007509, partial [Datura stramonium]|nr:hypothetical protein [Datura stramonium]
KPHVLTPLLSSPQISIPHQSTVITYLQHQQSPPWPPPSTALPATCRLPSRCLPHFPNSPSFYSSSLISASPASRSRVDLHLQYCLSVIVDSSTSTPPYASSKFLPVLSPSHRLTVTSL